MNISKAALIVVGIGIDASVGGCASLNPQQQADINTLLGSSVASTAVQYVAALDPQISGYLSNIDAAVAKDAPGVLNVACGSGNMGNLIFSTVETIDPKLISAATAQTEKTAYATLVAICPPNPAPGSIADVAREAFAAYQQVIGAATSGTGVSIPTAAAATKG